MDWTAFLEDFSDRLRLTSEQREVFLARLSDENLDKNETQVANRLNIGALNLKKHMNAIYAAAGQQYPTLAALTGRGKLPELRGCLKKSWRSAPQPPILGEPSQETRGGEDVDSAAIGGLQTSGLKPGAPKLKRDDTAKKTVLMLPASPESYKSERWKEEVKLAKEVIKKADKNENRYEFEDMAFIESSDVFRNLSDIKPYVLHISGDVEGIAELIIGNTSRITNDQNQQLSEIFKLHAQFIDCVILSGCSLEEQIREIVHHIEFVIIIPRSLRQENAVKFLDGFYYSLPSNRGIKGSYDAGIYELKQYLHGRNSTFDETSRPEIFFQTDEISRRNWKKELDVCIEELEVDPTDTNLWKKKADLLKNLGYIDEMNEAYEKAASFDPGNYENRVKQGDALESLGDHNKANVAYDKALKLEKEDYKIWWKKAIAQANIGEYNEADKFYKEALSLVSRFPWLVASPEVNSDKYVLCREHGNIVIQLKRTRESIQSYRTSLWLEPNYRLANYEKKQAYKRFYSKRD